MAKSKLHPYLRYRAGARRPGGDTALARPLGAARDGRVNVLVQLDADGNELPPGLINAGFRLHVRAGTILSGDIPRESVGGLDDVEGIRRAELAQPVSQELEAALPEARIPVQPGESASDRGRGVLIGIIDSGIDYLHPAFRNEDGSTRILSIWDQGLTARGERERSPDDFDYGVEYSEDDINEAIASESPLSVVRHQDPAPFHGTRVAGIAAGSGEPSTAAVSHGRTRFVGVAPGAQLVVVANTRNQARDPGTLGDSADTLDAIQYVIDCAEQKALPLVINHSQGDNIGAHDGSSLLELAIEHLFKSRPGRVMVKSAGNEGNKAHHASGTLKADTPRDVSIQVFAGVEELIVDIWYRAAGRISVQITPPEGEPTGWLGPEFNDTVDLSNGNSAFVDADLDDPGNHDNRIFVVLHKQNRAAVAEGAWLFQLRGQGTWDAWIQRDAAAAFTGNVVSAANTISIPGTSRGVITVGCYVNDGLYVDAPGTLSALSSRGPTRDGRRAPTLAAPGEEIMAPQPDPVFFGPMKGTSMSAPLVAGAVALMLANNPRLTLEQAREILQTTARRDEQTGNDANDEWGAGKLDIQAACERTARIARRALAAGVPR